MQSYEAYTFIALFVAVVFSDRVYKRIQPIGSAVVAILMLVYAFLEMRGQSALSTLFLLAGDAVIVRLIILHKQRPY
jgi:uncharacterized membrane protein